MALAAGGLAICDIGCRIEDGDALIDRALQINPNLAWAWLYSCWTKTSVGQPELAAQRAIRARRLSPNDPQTFSFAAAEAWAHLFAGNHHQAFELSQVATRDRPRFVLYLVIAAVSAVFADRTAEAELAVETILDVMPKFSVTEYCRVAPLRRPADAAKWEQGMRRAGLPV